MTGSLPIPERLEELTPAWLTDALRTGGHLDSGRVVDVHPEELGEGKGFLGDIARLRLDYEGEPGPRSLIAKIPKLANRAMGELIGAYERENCFYMELAGSLPLETPAFYYGDFDRDAASERQRSILALTDRMPRFLTGRMTQLGRWVAGRKRRRYILLIEDLEGTDSGDQVAGATKERCESVLRSAAQMHSRFWGSDELAGQFWLIPLGIDSRMKHGLFLNSRAALKARFGHLIDHDLAHRLNWISKNGVRSTRKLVERAPATLLHCDLRLDNLAFRGETPIVFDWQLVRSGPAAYDVAYFLSGAVDDLDGEQELDLLRLYYGELCSAGVEGYEFDSFVDDYRLAMLNVLQTLAAVEMIELGDARGIELLEVWMIRLRARLANFDPDEVVARASS